MFSACYVCHCVTNYNSNRWVLRADLEWLTLLVVRIFFWSFFNHIFYMHRYASYDGSARHIVKENLPHTYAITNFGDWMYWTEWNIKRVEKANKFTGSGGAMLFNSSHLPYDIQVVHPLRQPIGKYMLMSWNNSLGNNSFYDHCLFKKLCNYLRTNHSAVH